MRTFSFFGTYLHSCASNLVMDSGMITPEFIKINKKEKTR